VEKPVLIVTAGGRQQKLEVGKGPITIGRGDECTVSFADDMALSHRHARVYWQSGALRVADEGSLNGSFVNANRIEDAALHDGDEISVGEVTVRVKWPDERGGAAAPRGSIGEEPSEGRSPPAQRSILRIVLPVFLGLLILMLLARSFKGDQAPSFRFPLQGDSLSCGALIEWNGSLAGDATFVLQFSAGHGWQEVCAIHPLRNWVCVDTRLWPNTESASLRIVRRSPHAQRGAKQSDRPPRAGIDESGGEPVCSSKTFKVENSERWRAWESPGVPAVSSDVAPSQLAGLGQGRLREAERILEDRDVFLPARYRAVLLLKDAVAYLQQGEAPAKAAEARILLAACQHELRVAVETTMLKLESCVAQRQWPEARNSCERLSVLVDSGENAAEFLCVQRYLQEISRLEK